MIRIRVIPSDGGTAGPLYDLGAGWFRGAGEVTFVSPTHVSQVVIEDDVMAETIREHRVEYFGTGFEESRPGQATVGPHGKVGTIVYTLTAWYDGAWQPGHSRILEVDPAATGDPFDPAFYLGGCTVIGSQLDDTLWGQEGPDHLTGDLGNDGLNAGGGDDGLRGGYGDDSLWGGDGKDRLVAGSGDDLLHGGRGKDLLAGNGGADVFRFEFASDAGVGRTRDLITAFEPGRDTIDLAAIWSESPPNTSVPDPGFTFIGDEAYSGTRGELRYSHGILAGDRNGDARSDFQIEIGDRAAITEADIIL